jgi:hypothetical protein
LFKIDAKRLHRGSGAVDILIGIDHARLHGGNTLVNGNFAARQSPLGAVVFGAGPDGLCSVNRIHLVRLNDPVDLTSFWSTEQMGVEVNPRYTKRTLLSSIEKEEAKIIHDSAVKVGQQWMIPRFVCRKSVWSLETWRSLSSSARRSVAINATESGQ